MTNFPQAFLDELKKNCPIQQNVRLNFISRWKIGGIAELIITPDNKEQIVSAVNILKKHDIDYVIIGGTTNILFTDKKITTAILKISGKFSNLSVQDDTVEIDSGHWIPSLARRLANEGLSGVEHICGIPGTLGGLICMNGGSQRKGIGEHIITVESIDRDGTVIERSNAECNFTYRMSSYQGNEEIILKAKLKLIKKDRSSIRQEMLKIFAERKSKFPHRLPNCGSVFVSNPSMYKEYGPPGKIIEGIGYKGFRKNNVQVSPLHANFIVNTGNGKAIDVLEIIREVRLNVFNKTGYHLIAEAKYMSPKGELIPAHDERCMELEMENER
ncbi:UDP-N-acetylmuramate dehydrogenase [Halotalea alkalilenta]|uniref:UDP-N-acetylenolpyruvoylglucosamine reductase n=1 Tax=Halotalea alkalilenta TaxID=376489 RepID=A0A172YGR0_9GAMM|nr:UDP-N-acetylmuramate dehydrogenase [Halotalea alkalilenta]ANF58403.1 hypothetical protein A5892_13755 [Halotalea alkalilenta]